MRSDAQPGEFFGLTNFGSGLIVGLQLSLDLPRDGEALEAH